MRDQVPLRWIEDAEAKRVLAAALFEEASRPSWCRAGRAALASWLPHLCAVIAPPAMPGRPLLRMQPAVTRGPACRCTPRQCDDD
jgi:hypothetical protein